MEVLIRKYDNPAGQGILGTIFFDIPSKNDLLFRLESFRIRITGKNRLETLQRRWERKFKPMTRNWVDPEGRMRLVKIELEDGAIGRCPDRVLSEDGYWYDKKGNEVGEAGSSADEYEDEYEDDGEDEDNIMDEGEEDEEDDDDEWDDDDDFSSGMSGM